MTNVYDIMLITRSLEREKKCLTKCLHRIGDFCVSHTSRVTIPIRHVYGLIMFNLCSKNAQYYL